ncbi:hypothetical protein ASF48_05055 [Rathayibacter sp. Leaf299]|uniref:hypothetical protein n=1 Tax=Rathayibacter sp. Leaf299 TaxID=1736328 RepID=UPI0006FD3D7F|nr:hypothetical protein [Rathayibacter sp. Leaf299]KQQ22555.1 hypothetical protein ASF48_05055 [Rathayibacter sp. Leaf299]
MTTAQQLALLTREEQAVPCIRGHALWGRHLDDCDSTVADVNQLEVCTGCAPAPARVGRLCDRCYHVALEGLPRIGEHVAHGWTLIRPSITRAAGERVDASQEWRLPWNENARETVDLAYGQLCDMVKNHATELAVTPPGILVRAWVRDLDVYRFPTGTGSVREVEAYLGEVIAWEKGHAVAIAALPTAGVWVDELDDLLRRVRGQFPMDPPRPRRMPGLVCPTCGAARVYLHDAGTDHPYLMCGVRSSTHETGSGCNQTWEGEDIVHVITEGAAA